MGVLPDHCEKIMENVSVLRQSYMGKQTASAWRFPGLFHFQLFGFTGYCRAISTVALNSAIKRCFSECFVDIYRILP